MYRWHLTPVKLAKMYRKKERKCWKCKKADGDYFHMWWTCDKVKKNWESIYNELKKIFRYTFPKRPEACLLGLIGTEIKIEDQNLFMYATAAARTLLAQRWKVQDIPTIQEWQAKLTEYAELAKLSGRIRDQGDQRYQNNWSKFIEYLKKNCKEVKTLAGLT